jgi:phenylacetate-coenzyme A ligase PaaK-like adenylate-forming protein
VPEDWVILEAVDGQLQPVPDGVLGESSLLTVLSNDVQPFIRYELGDQIRFCPDPCPCGSPFRSFEVVGRQATLLQIGDAVLSPLVFDLEHESAQRVQLIQIKDREFELRIEPLPGVNGDLMFDEVSTSIANTLRQNRITEFQINRSQEPPRLTPSGKFHELIPLKKQ